MEWRLHPEGLQHEALERHPGAEQRERPAGRHGGADQAAPARVPAGPRLQEGLCLRPGAGLLRGGHLPEFQSAGLLGGLHGVRLHSAGPRARLWQLRVWLPLRPAARARMDLSGRHFPCAYLPVVALRDNAAVAPPWRAGAVRLRKRSADAQEVCRLPELAVGAAGEGLRDLRLPAGHDPARRRHHGQVLHQPDARDEGPPDLRLWHRRPAVPALCCHAGGGREVEGRSAPECRLLCLRLPGPGRGEHRAHPQQLAADDADVQRPQPGLRVLRRLRLLRRRGPPGGLHGARGPRPPGRGPALQGVRALLAGRRPAAAAREGRALPAGDGARPGGAARHGARLGPAQRRFHGPI
mmetsp:Transcript_110817/g.357698  ORF Transcript_110817/g.357698 Transcript_110817/m.357698 type:complete len:353 (-) Transcript_110817:119-1177(-)